MNFKFCYSSIARKVPLGAVTLSNIENSQVPKGFRKELGIAREANQEIDDVADFLI